jgi:hypothetical protein
MALSPDAGTSARNERLPWSVFVTILRFPALGKRMPRNAGDS